MGDGTLGRVLGASSAPTRPQDRLGLAGLLENLSSCRSRDDLWPVMHCSQKYNQPQFSNRNSFSLKKRKEKRKTVRDATPGPFTPSFPGTLPHYEQRAVSLQVIILIPWKHIYHIFNGYLYFGRTQPHSILFVDACFWCDGVQLYHCCTICVQLFYHLVYHIVCNCFTLLYHLFACLSVPSFHQTYFE